MYQHSNKTHKTHINYKISLTDPLQVKFQMRRQNLICYIDGTSQLSKLLAVP